MKKKYNFVKGELGVQFKFTQGGIVSPLLSNLVLHELDQFVSNLIEENRKSNEKKK